MAPEDEPVRSLADVPIIDRLLARRMIDDNGCWLWTGSAPRYGYLCVDNKMKLVHRLMATIAFGIDYADPIKVLHRCDVPICFNPDHLFLGTQKDNVQDAITKGRMTPGSKVSGVDHPLTLLKGNDRLEAVEMYLGGMTSDEVGDTLKVSRSVVDKVLGVVRVHVPVIMQVALFPEVNVRAQKTNLQ